MSVEHSHHLENLNATTPPPEIDLVASVPGAPPMPEGAEAMTIHVTLLPPCPAGRWSWPRTRPACTCCRTSGRAGSRA